MNPRYQTNRAPSFSKNFENQIVAEPGFGLLIPKVEENADEEEFDPVYAATAAIEVSREIIHRVPSRSLLRQNQYALKLLQNFCNENQFDPIDFSSIPIPDLDKLLAKFAMKACTRGDGELFRLSTFRTLQHALGRHFFQIRNFSLQDQILFPVLLFFFAFGIFSFSFSIRKCQND